MPLHSNLDPIERRRVIRGINEQINIFRATARKLRERLLVGAVGRSEELLIGLELVRLRFAVHDLMDLKDAFKANEKTITPPSGDEIESMRARVAQIEAINARNRRTKAIIRLAIEIVGDLDEVEVS